MNRRYRKTVQASRQLSIAIHSYLLTVQVTHSTPLRLIRLMILLHAHGTIKK